MSGREVDVMVGAWLNSLTRQHVAWYVMRDYLRDALYPDRAVGPFGPAEAMFVIVRVRQPDGTLRRVLDHDLFGVSDGETRKVRAALREWWEANEVGEFRCRVVS